jgi:hypothetical protein
MGGVGVREGRLVMLGSTGGVKVGGCVRGAVCERGSMGGVRVDGWCWCEGRRVV